MNQIDIGGIVFSFQKEWVLTKYDSWVFYKEHFIKLLNGIKAIDLLAFDKNKKELWLVEVKDYRNRIREKTVDLYTEVLKKSFDTLAALLPAKINATIQEEKEYAKLFLTAHKIRIVLYILQAKKPSKLFPQIINLSNSCIKFKEGMRYIDPHALITDGIQYKNKIPWDCSL